jgi:hypothetical protein
MLTVGRTALVTAGAPLHSQDSQMVMSAGSTGTQ